MLCWLNSGGGAWGVDGANERSDSILELEDANQGIGEQGVECKRLLHFWFIYERGES